VAMQCSLFHELLIRLQRVYNLLLQRLLRQHSHFCTSKASKQSTCFSILLRHASDASDASRDSLRSLSLSRSRSLSLAHSPSLYLPRIVSSSRLRCSISSLATSRSRFRASATLT
jgi:hypothetical protein